MLITAIWLFVGVALGAGGALSAVAIAKSLAARQPPKPPPLEEEFERLSQSFGFVLKSRDLPVSAELCQLMRFLQGKCTAISAFPRRPEVVVESDQDDCESGTHSGFPWDDVDTCRSSLRLQQRFNPDATIIEFGERAICPKCALNGAHLTWCSFISPPWTWEHLCGRAGWLVICDNCRRQVLFICDALN